MNPGKAVLHKKLLGFRIRSTSGGYIYPSSSFEREIAKSDIEYELKRLKQTTFSSEAVDLIWLRARKIFCILVLCSRPGLIENVIKQDQMQDRNIDHLLPLEKDTILTIINDSAAAELFYEKQWSFCAPDFSQMPYPRLLHDKTILPIVQETSLSHGESGTVTKLEFHHDYQPKITHGNKFFVRKELKIHDSSYENEVAVLSRLQTLSHPNVLRLKACYTYRGNNNIISPYMTGGTLESLFEDGVLIRYELHDILHMFSGLSSAIWALHDLQQGEGRPILKGLHSDLRPVNILVNNDRLILADFGISQVKSAFDDSKTTYKTVPGFYQPPECADLEPPLEEYHSTRASDIWAFGCILTDLLMLILKGPEALQAFHIARRNIIGSFTYYLYHDKKRLVKAVSDLISQARHQPGQPIVANLAKHINTMLKINPARRPIARLVTEHLYRLTLSSFSESLSQQFCKLQPNPAAAIEEARFQSWVSHFDAILELDANPTARAVMFESTTCIVRSLVRAVRDLTTPPTNLGSQALNEVRHINTKLFDLLPEHQKSSVIIDLRNNVLASLRPEDIPVAQTALEAIPYGGNIAAMVQCKDQYANLDHSDASTSERAWFEVPGSRRLHLRALSPVGEYHLAIVEGVGHPRLVLVERILGYDPPHHRELVRRLHAFCDLLHNKPSDLKIPTLFGLHNSITDLSVGLLYDLGERQFPKDHFHEPVMLRSLLEAQTADHHPCLGTRYQISSELADAILCFHSLEWYHKELTSRSVIFLFDATDDIEVQLVGFRHSRRAADSWSEGPPMKINHWHHDSRYVSRQGSRYNEFRPEYDYYSLGIMLIEIAFWKTIEEVMGDLANSSGHAAVEMMQRYIVPKLRFAMGSSYADAVLRCLDGTFDTHDAKQDVSVARTLFQDLVVKPLRALSNAISAPTISQTFVNCSRKRRISTLDTRSRSSPKRASKKTKQQSSHKS